MKVSNRVRYFKGDSPARERVGERTPPGRLSNLNYRQAGVALIVTLLLLSVITFMAVAFLVLSRTEAGSVAVETDQLSARLAADGARDRAIAEAIVPMLTSGNLFASGNLVVSTNYYNANGFFTTAPGLTSPTNVNFDYTSAGALVSATRAYWEQNIDNLMYNPRAPVFVITNRLTGASEFRFYRDENRNHQFEPTGYLPVSDARGFYFNITSGAWETPAAGVNYLSNYFVGDPQWIGILEHPDWPHSSSNRFVARVAYMVLPTGNSLDLNYMHNDAKANLQPSRSLITTMATAGDHFLRNQGAGTYELNLSGFLTDLNTNIWPAPDSSLGSRYFYDPTANNANKGFAFDDANALLRYRYSNLPTSPSAVYVPSPMGLFAAGAFTLRNSMIDYCSAGPVMITPWLTNSPGIDPPTFVWAGGDNPNHFQTAQDLFDTSKTATPATFYAGGISNFTDRLMASGNSTNSYDRYTLFRLLSQMGTESAPEANKINLNYCNMDAHGNIVPDMATNFQAWSAVQFFTNVADRLLANAGYNHANLSITNIQIWPTNYYTPAVHRLLQLAANIYDATTNKVAAGATNGIGYPSVFRPLFTRNVRNGVIFIIGFEEVTNATQMLSSGIKWHDLNLPTDVASRWDPLFHDMVYGVPLVVGAKKGWPNFNEFAMQTHLQVIRKLQFERLGADLGTIRVTRTNQMYMLSISNSLGIEAWNSYSNVFGRSVTLYAAADVMPLLTNETRTALIGVPSSPPVPSLMPTNNGTLGTNITSWEAFPMTQSGNWRNSFLVPLQGSSWILTNSEYSQFTRSFISPPRGVFEDPSLFPAPHWWMRLVTRVRYVVVDNNHIVDYVNLEYPRDSVDISWALMGYRNFNTTPYRLSYPNVPDEDQWITNHWHSGTPGNQSISDADPTFGIINQISICKGLTGPDPIQGWQNYAIDPEFHGDTAAATKFFNFQFGLGSSDGTYSRSNTFYAPFSPVGVVNFNINWQANDPLVHYTAGDLNDPFSAVSNLEVLRITSPSPLADLGGNTPLNPHYRPWGGNPVSSTDTVPPTRNNLAVKDPGMLRSDYWDFPAGKLPNPGWLGRVHRGTPWQTVYFKSPVTDLFTWTNWVGNAQWATNWGQYNTTIAPISNLVNDAYFSHPTNDWALLNLFTTAVNANGTRGQMSVNQTNLAAWSATLAGVNVLTNTGPASYGNLFIQPAGIYDPTKPAIWPPLVRIVNGIIQTRTNFFGNTYHQLGDILATPELTVNSPFLNTNATTGLTDELYERIPQQVLGLLRYDSSPRFLIYAYGQTLKPAEHSLETGSSFFGLCTNYQVTAEAATRAVVRIDGAPFKPRVVIESYTPLPPD